MKRSIESKLIDWKNNLRKKPLIIFGPRQVGKTYITKKFAKNEYKINFYFNLNTEPELAEIAKNNKSSIKELLQYLKNVIGFDPKDKNHILIIDEAQVSIEIFSKMKSWNEDKNILNNIILTGSWIDAHMIKNTNHFEPVGQVDILRLFPMTFEEFIWNHKDWKKFKFFIDKAINEKKSVEKNIHNELIKIFEKYIFVGGMPEIVKDYFEEVDPNFIIEKQATILDQYVIDMQRISKKPLLIKINKIFDGIASNLHKAYDNKSSRFRYTAIKHTARKREYEEIVEWILLNKIAYKINILSDPTDSFISTNKDIFKLYFIDLGMLSNRMKIQNILSSKDSYKSYAIENYVAIHLESFNIKTAFWEKRINNKNYEMDFLLKENDITYAIDAKTSKSQISSSMKMITKKYKINNIITITSQNFQFKKNKDLNIKNIPFYLLPWIKKLI